MKINWLNTLAAFLTQLYLLVWGTFQVALLGMIINGVSLAVSRFMFGVPFEAADWPALWCGLFCILLLIYGDLILTRRLVGGLASAAVDGLAKMGEVFR